MLRFSSVCLFPVNYNFQKKWPINYYRKLHRISCTRHHLIAWFILTFPFFSFIFFSILSMVVFISIAISFYFMVIFSPIATIHNTAIIAISLAYGLHQLFGYSWHTGNERRRKKRKLNRRAKPSNWNAHKILKIKIFTKRWAKNQKKRETNEQKNEQRSSAHIIDGNLYWQPSVANLHQNGVKHTDNPSHKESLKNLLWTHSESIFMSANIKHK